MSSFIAIKLDINHAKRALFTMPTAIKSAVGSRHVTRLVRQRVERGGERLWRLEDFRDLPFSAVAQALSRLKRNGTLTASAKASITAIARRPLAKADPTQLQFGIWHPGITL